MTTASTVRSPAGTIEPFAAAVVLPIAGVVAVLHCVARIFEGSYWFDEVYMLAICRNHLDWGSADQPPLTPAVAPGSIVALRLPAMAATAGAVVVAALIARELGCDRCAQGFTHWLTPYTLEPVQCLLVIWLVVRWARLRDPDRVLKTLPTPLST